MDINAAPGRGICGARGAAVAIGNFDGLHLGHMRLINALKRLAAPRGLPTLVCTFDRHPANALSGTDRVKMLADARKKAEILSSAGVDALVIERFSHEFASLAPEDFIKRKLIREYGARLIVAGKDFRFGIKASGTVETLREIGRSFGLPVEEIPPYAVCVAGAGNAAGKITVSSSYIRALIRDGLTDRIPPLLGRLYSIRGFASRENKPDSHGRPTAVISPDVRAAVPRPGVYITRTLAGGALYRGITAVEAAPVSAAGGAGSASDPAAARPLRLNNYAIDFDNDLHGGEIEIFFYLRLRDIGRSGGETRGEARFESDIGAAKGYFDYVDVNQEGYN